MSAWGCLPRGCLPRGGVCWGGVSAPLHAGIHPPPVDRMTDRCKNITLPQTSFAGGNKNDLEQGVLNVIVATEKTTPIEVSVTCEGQENIPQTVRIKRIRVEHEWCTNLHNTRCTLARAFQK